MKKVLITIFFITAALISISLGYFLIGIPKSAKNIEYGVTFAPKVARDYDLDPSEVLDATLNELGVRKFRLIAFWDEIEKEKGSYDFSDLDWQIEAVSKNNGKIILAFGQKVPRWPECHLPDWAWELPEQQRQAQILKLITAIVSRYRDNQNIKIWQVENEPFFFQSFGHCPKQNAKFLDQEIALVHSLDKRPVMLTSSGEMSLWLGEYRRADIFGTSLYKYVYNRFFGYMKYKIPAIFYERKIALLKLLFGNKPIIVSELQAEPWIHGGEIKTSSPEIIKRTMSPEKLIEIINYSRQCGFAENYFWGVEWWYWLKTQGDASYWEKIKTLTYPTL